jgi:hypothetical protein
LVFKESSDSITKTYSGRSIYYGKSDETNQDKIFGITVQCKKPVKDGLTDFYVYQVDIGSSRGFDNNFTNISSANDENRLLFSRTPQVLSIDNSNGSDIVTIIKSKMKNTRIHLPRYNYEKQINSIKSSMRKESDYELSLSNPRYLEKKYLKYKLKYIKLLKNNINRNYYY